MPQKERAEIIGSFPFVDKVVVTDHEKNDTDMSISRMLGDPELICQISARDRRHFLTVIESKIGRITGIAHVSTHLALEVAKYRVDHGNLESGW